MSTNTWIQFRTQLFEMMEERRAKVALFRLEQVYFFISRCSKLFTSPGAKDGQDALRAIQDEGTFLLVADSLPAFLARLRALGGEEEANQPVAVQPDPQPTDRGARQTPQPDADVSRNAARPKPGLKRPITHCTEHQPPHHPQPTSDARRSSAGPFDADRIKQILNDTLNIQG